MPISTFFWHLFFADIAVKSIDHKPNRRYLPTTWGYQVNQIDIIPLDAKIGEPGFLIKVQGSRILFDTPLALYRREISNTDLNRLQFVGITHRHRDHFGGIDRLFFEVPKMPVFAGNEGTSQGIRNKLTAYNLNLFNAFSYRCFELVEKEIRNIYQPNLSSPPTITTQSGGKIFDIYVGDGYTIRGTILKHGTINSIAYALQVDDQYKMNKAKLQQSGLRPGPWINTVKQQLLSNTLSSTIEINGKELETKQLLHLFTFQKGTKIAYATDFDISTPNQENLLQLITEADVFLCEAAYLHQDLHLALQNGHQTSVHAANLAQEGKVKKLHLFHHSLRYGKLENAEDRFREESTQVFKGPIV